MSLRLFNTKQGKKKFKIKDPMLGRLWGQQASGQPGSGRAVLPVSHTLQPPQPCRKYREIRGPTCSPQCLRSTPTFLFLSKPWVSFEAQFKSFPLGETFPDCSFPVPLCSIELQHLPLYHVTPPAFPLITLAGNASSCARTCLSCPTRDLSATSSDQSPAFPVLCL